jgi:hypothetical protein
MRPSTDRQYNYTSARERAGKQGTGGVSYLRIPDDTLLYKPSVGTALIDIMPYIAGQGNPWAEKGQIHWERTYYVHKGIGLDAETFICPRMTAKQSCPICEARRRLAQQEDPEKEDLIKDLAPRQRQLFQLIDLRNPDKGIQLWDISYYLFGKVLDMRLRNSDEDDKWDYFFHLEDGLSLKIGWEEESFGGVNFCRAASIDFRPRAESYEEKILKETLCLDNLLIIPNYENLKKTFLGAVNEDIDEPRQRMSSETRTSTKKQQEDWNEEDEEKDLAPRKKQAKKEVEHWEEEQDEEPTPRKKQAKKDEEEEEDWDEEDEEEEEDWDEEEQKKEPTPRKKNKFSSAEHEDSWDDDEEEPSGPKWQKG